MLVMTLLGIGIGYAAAVVFDSPSGTRETPATTDAVPGEPERRNLDREIALLRSELEEERSARLELESELDRMRTRLARAFEPDAAEPDPVPAPPPAAPQPAQRAPVGPNQRPWFDRGALEAAGLSSSEISEVEERFERFEMEKLYRMDEAKREGTFRSGPYNRAVQELTQELRDDLGPAGYDAYLYATGRENRVLIKQVLSDSPAADAGVEDGDIVIRYAGERMFHHGEFQAATAAGTRGETVELEVVRDGVTHRLSVARGPLGVRISRVRAPPLARR